MSAAHFNYFCPEDEYRASPGLSYSESKVLAKSPAHYRWMKDNPSERAAPTAQMILGTMLHCAVLEPARFERDYVVAPNVSKNSNEWKAFATTCALAGQRPITEDDLRKVFGMRDAMRAHPRIGKVLQSGHPEVSCWWHDYATHVDCRARLDWIHEVRGGVLPCDVKTTSDASPEAFQRSAFNLAYHRQAAWYEDGAEACFKVSMPMLFLVVESTPPFACAAYTLHPMFMQLARAENARLRALLAHCRDMDDWPGYDPAITELKPPRWALDPDMRREMDVEEMTE